MGYLRHGSSQSANGRPATHTAESGFESRREHEYHPECLSAGNGLRSLNRASDRGQVTCG